jgi:protein gp37
MIFTVSMGDLFGAWVPIEWVHKVLNVVKDNSQHVFQFLTKNPRRYSWFAFPKNTWIGATLDGVNLANLYVAKSWLLRAKTPSVRFLSFEPLLKQPSVFEPDDFEGIDWIIVGAQTNPYRPPKPEWVERIIKPARELGIPIFLKNNLRWPEKIQEFPEVR